MPRTLSLLIYNLLLPLGLLVMLPGALRKMRQRGGAWSDLWQRLGFFSHEQRQALTALPTGANRLWMHAVSVGEVGVATKLLRRLLATAPELGVILTTTTPTGHALARDFAASQSGRVLVLYSPVDLRCVAARFLNGLRPSQIVLVEAEVWPNLVTLAHGRGIAVRLVNARLSPRSERRFRQLRALVKPVFGLLNQVLVQEPEDAARWAGLGVRAAAIQHTGSIKYDPEGGEADPAQVERLRQVLLEAGIGPERPILLAASTHPGEEALIGGVFNSLRERFADLVFLVVPRHVERAEQVCADLCSLGLAPRRRSLIGPGDAIEGKANCIVIDTTGELRAWQVHAVVVVVGKSFLGEGGQNPAEAALARKPVVFGPHMENFEALVDLLMRHDGAVQVSGAAGLEATLAELLANPARRSEIGAAGHAALAAHQGATAATVTALLAKPV